MNQKFKCRDCGLVFDADDSQQVNCPSCNSDNLDFQKIKGGTARTAVVALIAFVVAIGFGVGLYYIVKGTNRGEDVMVSVSDENVVSFDDKEEEIVFLPDVEPIVEPMLAVSEIYADKGSKTYSFNCLCNNVPADANVEYKLFNFGNGNLTATSKDGKFSGIKPAVDGYKVVATVKVGAKSYEVSKELPSGFDEFPEKEIVKLTVPQIQTLVNQMISSKTPAALSKNPAISQDVKFKCVDGNEDDTQGTMGYSMVISRFNTYQWSGITVVSLGYNNDNKVNLINIKPIYN